MNFPACQRDYHMSQQFIKTKKKLHTSIYSQALMVNKSSFNPICKGDSNA